MYLNIHRFIEYSWTVGDDWALLDTDMDFRADFYWFFTNCIHSTGFMDEFTVFNLIII